MSEYRPFISVIYPRAFSTDQRQLIAKHLKVDQCYVPR